MTAPLVLASASPRRRALLAQLGLSFEVAAGDVPETPREGERAEQFALRMAREKAAVVADRCPNKCILAADTVVVVDGTVFGKPTDRDDARRMLQALSGRTHRVLTAVALIDATGRRDDVFVESHVRFRAVTAAEIETYLDSGEPFDKAGAYGLQGQARQFVLEVRGSESNVIGLPMDEVAALFRRHLPARVDTPA